MIKVKLNDNADSHGKRRIFFACHPDNFEKWFKIISIDIFRTHDCAIYYTDDPGHPFEDIDTELGQINLFVFAVSSKMLTEPNYATDVVLPHALFCHVPILPIMLERGLDSLYVKKFGELEYLDLLNSARRNRKNYDPTAIGYEEKLKKFLESVLISDELAQRIREAFDAYVFLSYRKKDRKYANELMRLIHDNPSCRDIAIWYDEFLVPGEGFNNAIQDALEKSSLFTLLVTPNLINEENYVHTTEYPAARSTGKPIIPMEMVETDEEELARQYEGIPQCSRSNDDDEFKRRLISALSLAAKEENDSDDAHNFLIGLAYLEGIDVEKNTERAVSLITNAAKNGLLEAIDKIAAMYHDGIGVERNWPCWIDWLEKSVETAKKKYSLNDLALIDRLWNLGRAYYNSGRYKDSLAILKKVYHAQKKLLGEDDENTLKTYEFIGSIYSTMGNYDKSLAILSEVWAIKELEYGEDDPRTLATKELAAEHILDSGYELGAAQLLMETAHSYEKVLGSTSLPYLSVMETVSYLNSKINRAPEHVKVSLDMLNSIYTLYIDKYGLDEDHPDVLNLKESIASCKTALGEYDEALKILEEVYRIRLKVFGENSPATCFTIESIAEIYWKKDDYEKSLELNLRSYDIQKKLFGDNYPPTLSTLHNIGIDHEYMEEYEKALETLTKVYSLRKVIIGEDHPDTLMTLIAIGRIQHRSGDSKKALKTLSDAYKLAKKGQKDKKEENQSSYSARKETARVYEDIGDLKQACSVYEELYQSRLYSGGDDLDDPDHFEIVSNLARLCSETEQPEESLTLYETLYEYQANRSDENDPDLIDTMTMLAIVYDDLDKDEKAIPLAAKVYKYYVQTYGADNPDTLDILFFFAGLCYNTGQHENAMKLFETIYNYRKASLGEDDPETISARKWIEICRSHLT